MIYQISNYSNFTQFNILIIAEIFIERCADLNVHTETIVAYVLIGNQNEELMKETETISTLTKDLLKWLEDHQLTLSPVMARENCSSHNKKQKPCRKNSPHGHLII